MKVLSIALIMLISLNVFSSINDGGNGLKSDEKKLSSKIVDAKTGEALAGVKIYVPNTNIVLYTDLDGKFELPINNEIENKEVVISYLSYETKRIPVKFFLNNQSPIQIEQVK